MNANDIGKFNEGLLRFRDQINADFNKNELTDLCFGFGIDYDRLSGENTGDKARELILYVVRRNRLAELVEKCQELRPETNWFAWKSTPAKLDREAKPEPAAPESHLPLEESTRRPEKNKQIKRILFLAADPTDAARLRSGEEYREMRKQCVSANLRDQFDLLKPEFEARIQDITGALLREKPQIIHFSGHGTEEGGLCFMKENGETQIVEPEALSELFEQFKDQVQCVLLSACFAETQARAIAKHINFVIGMHGEIGQEAAIAFSRGFYQALFAGERIEKAFSMGKIQIRLPGIPEYLTPVLIKKEDQPGQKTTGSSPVNQAFEIVTKLKEFKRLLDGSRYVFVQQRKRVRRLDSLLQARLGNKVPNDVGYDKTFFLLYDEMNDMERGLVKLIRGMTSGRLHDRNKEIRKWVKENPPSNLVLPESPATEKLNEKLEQLQLHLDLWFNRYNDEFCMSERHCLVYMDDLDIPGVDFPEGLDKAVGAVLKELQ